MAVDKQPASQQATDFGNRRFHRCLFTRMSAGLLLVLSVTTEDAPLSPSPPPAKPSPPPPWPPLLPGTEMCDNGAPPGFVASRGAWGSLDCDGGTSSGGSFWYHTLLSTCGATLCTAEIDAATFGKCRSFGGSSVPSDQLMACG